jgi:hypothetical protein
MTSRKCIGYFFIIICFILIRCERNLDTVDSINLKLGTCDVSVKGYINRIFYGQAIYENVSGPISGKVFFLLLEDINLPEDEHRFVLFSGNEPDNGTYSIANLETRNDSTRTGFFGTYNDSEYYGHYQSTGGYLEIISSSNNRLKGLFNFTAYENVPNTGGDYKRVEIIVNGKFYAEEGSTGINLE